MYRRIGPKLEVLSSASGAGLTGAVRDEGAWSIPKGRNGCRRGRRGRCPPGIHGGSSAELQSGSLHPLGEIRQRGRQACPTRFAVNWRPGTSRTIASNTFEIEWPPKKRTAAERFPEVDRAEWFTLPIARTKILEGPAPPTRSAGKTCDKRIEITQRHRGRVFAAAS